MKRVNKSNLIHISVILMMISMFIIGYMCSRSYEGTVDTFQLKDWWSMGMYGALKYILYDIVILIFIWNYKRSLLLPFCFFALFSIKDFVQFFIDGNMDTLPDSYLIFFIGLIVIIIFTSLNKNVMKNDEPAGTEHPKPPPTGK